MTDLEMPHSALGHVVTDAAGQLPPIPASRAKPAIWNARRDGAKPSSNGLVKRAGIDALLSLDIDR